MTIDRGMIENLDRVIHERSRLMIFSLLAPAEAVSFTELKQQLNLTDGNLSVHLRTLEEAGYVTARREFAGRKPRTLYSLTPAGRTAFERYIDLLESFVEQTRAAGCEKPVSRPELVLPRH